MEDARAAVLIYDADCPVCRKAVEAIGASCYPGAFEFRPCGSEETSRRYPGIPRADCLLAVHLVLPGGAVLSGSSAAPEILCRLPRYRWAAPFLRLPLVRSLASFVYKAFARNRHWIGHILFP